MISDEMRELLSSYVDGELAASDVARVEELTKRDPELRREIAAYRQLRRKLRDWDAADHAADPSPLLVQRALERAHEVSAARRRTARGRIVALLFHPAVAAAGLLVAVAAGWILAHGTAGSAPVVAPHPGSVAALGGPVEPLESLLLEGEALAPLEVEDFSGLGDRVPFDEVLRHQMVNRLVDGVPISDRARALMLEMRREEEQTELRRRTLAEQTPAERRTRAYWDPRVHSMLMRYDAKVALETFVLVEHPEVPSELPLVDALPVGARAGMDTAVDEDRIAITTDRLARGMQRLTLLGEVWIGARDGSDRTRLVAADGWIRDVEHLPMAWADDAELPANRHNLELSGIILGPGARRRLLESEGRDPALIAWLKESYALQARPADALRARAKRQERAVARLVGMLARHGDATGFAVFSGTRMLGMEFFASHRLMLAYAPRLLQGYLMEAGPEGLRIEGRAQDALQRVQELLSKLPEQTRLEVEKQPRGTRVGWPDGLDRVLMRAPAGGLTGHGLVLGARPVHLTIFGE